MWRLQEGVNKTGINFQQFGCHEEAWEESWKKILQTIERQGAQSVRVWVATVNQSTHNNPQNSGTQNARRCTEHAAHRSPVPSAAESFKTKSHEKAGLEAACLSVPRPPCHDPLPCMQEPTVVGTRPDTLAHGNSLLSRGLFLLWPLALTVLFCFFVGGGWGTGPGKCSASGSWSRWTSTEGTCRHQLLCTVHYSTP